MRRWLLLLPLVACGGETPAEDPAPTVETTDAPEGQGAWSNARSFYAVWRAVEGEVPMNEEFTAEVWLFEDDTCATPLEDADVVIDCRMPAHRHGMNVDVELVHEGDGRYVAEGMMCHMLGHWELYVDRTSGPITERVQWDLWLR